MDLAGGCRGEIDMAWVLMSTPAVRVRYNKTASVPCRTSNGYTGNATVRCQADGKLAYEGGCGELYASGHGGLEQLSTREWWLAEVDSWAFDTKNAHATDFAQLKRSAHKP
jgi:hypothetical protein